MEENFKSERENSVQENKQNHRRFVRNIWFLIAGLALTAGYFILIPIINHFVFPGQDSLDYLSNWLIYYWYLPPMLLSESLWKIILLLPGAVFVALFLSRSGFSINWKKIAEYKYIIIILTVLAAVAILLSVNFAFNNAEITDDENAYEYQAQLLTQGKLYTQPPPSEESFRNIWLFDTNGKFTGKYSFGHPLIMALGLIWGDSRIFIFLLSVLMIPLIYFISKNLFKDKDTAVLSSFLMLISPFYILMSSTKLSHSTTAFLLSIFMLLFILIFYSEKKSKWHYLLALISGVSAGWAFNIRPLTGLGFLFPFLILLIIKIAKGEKFVILKVLPMALGFLLILYITLWINKQITGDYFRFTFDVYNQQYRPYDMLGFGGMKEDFFPGPIFNLITNSFKVNLFLFGMPAGLSFLFIYIFRSKKSSGDKLCYAIVASSFAAYFFYPMVSDAIPGPRYYYEMIVPLIVISARGIIWLDSLFKEKFSGMKQFVSNFVMVSVVLALLTFLPERISHINKITKAVNEPYELLESKGINNAVVFFGDMPSKGWVLGIRNNNPELNDRIIKCRHVNAEADFEVMNAFPGRNYYSLFYDKKKNKNILKPFEIDLSSEKADTGSLEAMLKKYPNNLALLEALFKVCTNAKQFDAAYKYANRLTALGRKPAGIYKFYLMLGTNYLKANQQDKALEATMNAITPDNPELADAYFNLGYIYISSGDKINAEKAWMKAVELKPGFLNAYYNLLQLYQDNGDSEKASIISGKIKALEEKGK